MATITITTPEGWDNLSIAGYLEHVAGMVELGYAGEPNIGDLSWRIDNGREEP